MKLIKRKRREDVEERKKVQAHKDLTISNTDSVIKTCGHICRKVKDVDELITRKLEAGDSAVKEALLCQMKYLKSVNRGLVKGSLFFCD